MKKESRERFQQIVKVFASYGFGYILESKKSTNKKSPVNLRKAIEELGPTFIKIGQILSTRSDLLPQEYVNELIKLQDSAPKVDIDTLKSVFEQSVHRKMEECFIYFNEEPMASASIAQVHEAVLLNGERVVVKIQRPDIYEQMKIDIAILRRLVKFTNTKLDIKIVDPLEVLDEIEITTEQELDFLLEGKNILKFKDSNKENKPVYVPKLITDIWSDKVITLEKIEGFKVNDINNINKEGYNNKDIAHKLALCYCDQIFKKGFFHADPHPGNILISDGKICFIDFGIMGVLDENLREWFNSSMAAIATKDKNKLVDCILAIGIKSGRIDRGQLYDDISYVIDTYLTTSLKNIKMTVLIQEIFDITRKNNIQLPRELVILVRCLMILEGVLAEIDPEIEIIDVVISFVKSENKFDLLHELNKEEIILSAYRLVRDILRIPSKTTEILNRLSNGKSDLKLSIVNLEKIVEKVDAMVNRVTGAVIISSLLISSSLITSSKIGPCINEVSLIGIVGYVVAFFLALILIRNMIKTGLFRIKDKNK